LLLFIIVIVIECVDLRELKRSHPHP